VLGTFALYHREPIAPSLEDVGLTLLMSRTVAVLIEWWRGEEARRQLLEQEHAARVAAEDANLGKDEFVATLSHELRTPLNAIMGWTRMLRMPGLPAETAERAMDAIDRNAQAQSRLIEDLLDIARIARGGLRLDVARVDLVAVAQAAVDAIKPAADAKGVRLTTRLPAPAPLLEADAARLQQVIWNLLSNAVKFTPAGGDVTLAVDGDPDVARVIVSDTGAGIAPELLPHVFERYRQGNQSHGGLGLGLAIASSVAALHGGSIRVASAGPGQGARFELLLPADAVVTSES
jgi:signal transduction histidine kinase